MLKNRYSVTGGTLRPYAQPSSRDNSALKSARVTANMLPDVSAGTPVGMMPAGGVGFNRMFTGILPETEESLIPYYRDCYQFDAVAGATIDIISSFPFSDWTLTGIDSEEMKPFNDTLSRINMRALLPEISNCYLKDGAFIGSLIYDARTSTFQDIMVHDRLNCSITHSPLFSQEPIIKANSAQYLNAFIHSDSPYVRKIMESYPKAVIDAFTQGEAVLDPVTTIYVPRRTQVDQVTTSYLKRLLPFYILEKTLFRGTLIEATKRMRATTHVQLGTDVWEPTPKEMQQVLAQFQMSEMDPLGAWVVTRQGVQVQDIRQAGEMWKWTDVIDTLVPHKLRALGISEAFLAGDAAYATAETAMTVFLENMEGFRDFVKYKTFDTKMFPLIAVMHRLFKDPTKAKANTTAENLMYNLSDRTNLKIPDLQWHKKLITKDASEFDLLDKLSEKGLPIPLKMLAAAGGIDLSSLLQDLKEDREIRGKISAATGVPMPASNQGSGNPGSGGGDDDGGMGYSEASLQKLEARAELRSLANPVLNRRRSILQRDYGESAVPLRTSKSGKVLHSVYNEHKAVRKHDEIIAKAAKNLRDPETRARVRAKIIERVGRMPNVIK